jgi:ABC-type dipeptide/oligopeptide/nickel transport system ATPase subunit
MEKGLVLGVMGKARSGKDTFSEILAETLFEVTGERFTLMAFAHELKLMCQRFFDLSYDQLWGDLKEAGDKRYPKKGGGFWSTREILQFVGTECFRSIDPNFWVKNLSEL